MRVYTVQSNGTKCLCATALDVYVYRHNRKGWVYVGLAQTGREARGGFLVRHCHVRAF